MRRIFLLLNVLFLMSQSNVIANSKLEQDWQPPISGIVWTTGLNWQQVIEKAKNENKYIFFDCYATWCLPCQKMDKNVYSDKKVAEFVNEKFISVKVQMDRTAFDDEGIKMWYEEARNIQSHYSISSFPSFLFFAPNGTPVHKGVGYKNPEEFLQLLGDVFNPAKQYYHILEEFQNGKIDTSEMKGLARALKYSDKVVAGKIAADYLSLISTTELQLHDNVELMREFNESPEVQQIALAYLKSHNKELSSGLYLSFVRSFQKSFIIRDFILKYFENLNRNEFSKIGNAELLIVYQNEPVAKVIADNYLKKLTENELFGWENLMLLGAFTKNSKDIGFEIFYKKGNKVNDIVRKQDFSNKDYYYPYNYAGLMVNNIISQEEIQDYLNEAIKNGSDNNINWDKIYLRIRKKYSKENAEEVVLTAKVNLYEYFTKKYDRYWPQYIKSNIKKIMKYGVDTTNKMIDGMVLNNFAWDGVFYHSNNKKQLNTAIKWMAGVVRRNPKEASNIDTYANLLYKVGRIKEAIRWEEVALKISTISKNEYNIKLYQGTIDKMMRRYPTWLVQ